MICRTLSLVLLVVLGSLARGETFGYLSVAAAKRIAVYQLDSATGKLTPIVSKLFGYHLRDDLNYVGCSTNTFRICLQVL